MSNNLRNLGKILIELGGVELNSRDLMQADGGVADALRDLTGIAGLRYKKAVELCFKGTVDDEEVLRKVVELEDFARKQYNGKPYCWCAISGPRSN